MTPDPQEFLTHVAARIIASEIERRVGSAAPTLVVPDDLTPLQLLAHRAFPKELLERRLRFLRAVRWYPEDAPVVIPGLDPPLPAEASLEDWLAAVHGASMVDARDVPSAALAWSLGRPSRGVTIEARNTEPLDRFFDDAADRIDPGWRDYCRSSPAVPPAWSRLEAVTTAPDRWFGRSRSGALWDHLAVTVGRLGEEKRRRWR